MIIELMHIHPLKDGEMIEDAKVKIARQVRRTYVNPRNCKIRLNLPKAELRIYGNYDATIYDLI